MKKTRLKALNYALPIAMAAALLAGGPFLPKYASAKQSLNPDPSTPQYHQKYATIEEARAAGNEINERIAAEGIALFKNENGALPLAKGSSISIFGACSNDPRPSGGGSGSGTVHEEYKQTTEEMFTKAGFRVNKKLSDLYAAKNTRDEIGTSSYTADITGSYKNYNDAAIIFVSRAAGSENSDGSLGNGTSKHSQELTDNELALFEHVKNAQDGSGEPVFKKIILCINTSNPFEVSCYQDDPRVQGVIWMGLLGATGARSLPKIINGEINPSAHTVDVWPANHRKDPAWFNFATNAQVGGSINITGRDPSGKLLSEALTEDGKAGGSIFKALTYKEGIYMGYRWYETAATVDGYFNGETNYADPLHGDDTYYNRYNGVLYPFGYGLSYTSFSWTAGAPSLAAGEITGADAGTEVTLPVTVKNTGKVSGKDVVQLYAREPYGTNAPIEKSDITFINSAKTKLLEPGEEQTVNITFNIRDLASFDWNDINGNGFQGYELEAGDYDLLLRTDSHTDKNEGFEITYSVGGEGIKYNSEDKDSPLNYNCGYGENAKAVFSQADEYNCSGVGAINANGDHATARDMDYVTRADWKLPTPSSADQLNWTDEAMYVLFNQTYTSSAGTNGDRQTDPWYKTADDIPGYGKPRAELKESDWKQASDVDVAARKNGKTEIQLRDMIGVPFDDVKWTTFLNQLTFDELTSLTQDCRYKSPGLDVIGKTATEEKDGPGQIQANAGKGTFWCCATTISATYNPELAYEMGCHSGQECLVLNISGWYAPAANTHRLAFNGRNFEYYSSDGRQGGYICAAVTKGIVENGIHVYVKHYVCNDMETCRNYGGGVSIFLTEQALREIYLKPFEIAAKIGNMNGIMTCHGKVGLIRAESNYYLCNYFLYDECGYDGCSVTDANAGGQLTTVVNGSAQTVTADRLVRCFVTPLAWNYTPASSDAALNGRKAEGRYDAENNRILVPEINVDQTKWYYTGSGGESAGYKTEVTSDGVWDNDSPTQWYAVRMTAKYLLYQTVNSAAMGVGNGDQLGVSVRVHSGGDDETTLYCSVGQLIQKPQSPAVNTARERFVGWYTDKECNVPASFPMVVTKPMDLYPLIVPMTSCVQSYSLNYSGADAAKTEYYEVDSVVKLPAYDPVREGYAFGGWYLEQTCVNKVNADDAASLVIKSDRTFYAKWIAIAQYTVTFIYNYDGAPAARSVTVDAGEKILPPMIAPTREGYVFKGWYIDEAGEYEADFTSPVEYSYNLYACWERGGAAVSSASKGLTAAVYVLSSVAAVFAAGATVFAVLWLKSKGKINFGKSGRKPTDKK